MKLTLWKNTAASRRATAKPIRTRMIFKMAFQRSK
jgi:hypothetical protein